MNYEDQQEQAELVVIECEGYWRASGISPRKIEEMKEELGNHLQEALLDGKPVEFVIGDDTFVFAEEWGRPHVPQQSPVAHAVEQVAFVFTGIAFAGAASHLRRRSYDVPFDLRKMSSGIVRGHVVAFTTNFSMRQYVRRSGLTEELEELSWNRLFIYSGAITVGYAVLLGINLVAKDGDYSAFSEWSWKSTAIAGLGGGTLLWLAREKQQAG